MPWNPSDLAFKILINRLTTSDAKAFYEEFGANTIDINQDEVYIERIPSAPAAVAGRIELRTAFVLTEDLTVGRVAGKGQAWIARDPQVPAGVIPTATEPVLKDWISDKYGTAYRIMLEDSLGNEIFPADSSEWFFNYKTGLLTFNGTPPGTPPYRITGYRYIGAKLGTYGLPQAGQALVVNATGDGLAYATVSGPGGTLPVGLIPNSTLRWDGVSSWVESGTLLNEGDTSNTLSLLSTGTSMSSSAGGVSITNTSDLDALALTSTPILAGSGTGSLTFDPGLGSVILTASEVGAPVGSISRAELTNAAMTLLASDGTDSSNVALSPTTAVTTSGAITLRNSVTPTESVVVGGGTITLNSNSGTDSSNLSFAASGVSWNHNAPNNFLIEHSNSTSGSLTLTSVGSGGPGATRSGSLTFDKAAGVTLTSSYLPGVNSYDIGINMNESQYLFMTVSDPDDLPNASNYLQVTPYAAETQWTFQVGDLNPVQVPVDGMIRYNTTTNLFEGYENGSWERFSAAGSIIAPGTVTDSILKWDGSDWVEDTSVTFGSTSVITKYNLDVITTGNFFATANQGGRIGSLTVSSSSSILKNNNSTFTTVASFQAVAVGNAIIDATALVDMRIGGSSSLAIDSSGISTVATLSVDGAIAYGFDEYTTSSVLPTASTIVYVGTFTGPITLTLPVAPVDGQVIMFKDKGNSSLANTWSVVANTGQTLETSILVDNDFASFRLQWVAADGIWYLI